jgi:hypothetical protein
MPIVVIMILFGLIFNFRLDNKLRSGPEYKGLFIPILPDKESPI